MDISIVIADDEPLSLKSEEMLIKREFPEIRIIGMAEDGITVKKIIQEKHPDIVLIDIRMPGLTGLEVMELMKNHKGIHYIISTAYSEFDYVHSALNLKADGYLLKPTRRQEAIDTIRKVIDDIRTERESEQERINAETVLHAVNPTLEREIILSICRSCLDGEKLSTWMKVNNVKFTCANIAVFQDFGVHTDENSEQFVRNVKQILEGVCKCIVSYSEDRLVVLMFIPENILEEEQAKYTENIARMIAAQLGRYDGSEGNWHVGISAKELEDLVSSYEDCAALLNLSSERIKTTIPDKRDATGYANAARQFIENNFAIDISLEQCATAIGISSYYLSHIFREENGMSFVEYLGNARIAEAKRLLGETNIPIKDIVQRCGYGNISYFYRSFKKATGDTVGEYRKKYSEMKGE